MAYVTPGTVAAGDVATAAAWNVLTNDVIDVDSRLRVFTTEAARNAAITSPTEGMQVYLTAPTVSAATGATITGIRQVYNGANWVTVTPLTGFVATLESTTSLSYVALTTPGPVVTIETGTIALVTLSAELQNGAAGRTPSAGFSVSGATTIAASDGARITVSSGGAQINVSCSNSFFVALTAGTNTFTMLYKATVDAVNFKDRTLTVVCVA